LIEKDWEVCELLMIDGNSEGGVRMEEKRGKGRDGLA